MVAIISHTSHRNHRMAKVGKGPLGPSSPAPAQAGLPTAGSQEYVLVVFGGLQGGDSSFSLGSLCPVSKYIIYSKINKCFLMFQIETPMFQFVSIASCPISGHSWKGLGSPHIFMHKDEFPPGTSPSWTGPALSLSSHVRYSRSLIIFVALS